MTQETYRFAYDGANAELREIVGQFEQLQARKEQIEQVVEALKVLLMDETVPATTALEATANVAAEPIPFPVQQAMEATVEPIVASFSEPAIEPEPAYAGEQSADPFQRRIDNALRHGLGARESRILPRALNGLLSRA